MNRLFIGKARGARARLVGIAVGVMIGVALFLLLWGAAENLGARSERGTWAEGSMAERSLSDAADLRDHEAALSPDVDFFEGRAIPTVTIAVTPTTTIAVPGVAVIPGPGEYAASPAMVELIDAQPAELLGDRYGTRIGVIGPGGLESPEQLLVVMGASAAELTRDGSVPLVEEFAGRDFVSSTYRALAVVGAIAVLVPVLLLIGIVTDLGAAQRAERIATLRLIGATARKVARMTAIETAATTAAGAVLGVGLYFALIPLAARIRVNSGRFYAHDLVASPVGITLVVLITVGLATLVAWWRALRSDLGPLGGSRERHERPPKAASLIPLALGVALVLGLGAGAVPYGPIVFLVVVLSFVLTVAGVLWAGPYLTYRLARMARRRSRSAAALMATGRISRHPRASFRAVSGLIVAVFTATVFSVAVTTASGVPEVEEGPDLVPATVLGTYVAQAQDPAAVEAVMDSLRELPGVEGVSFAWEDTEAGTVIRAQDLRAIAPDADLPPGAEWVGLDWQWRITGPESDPAAPYAGTLFAATDGAAESIERARTALETANLNSYSTPRTRTDSSAVRTIAADNQFAVLAYLGILVATAISAVALAVSSLASVFERRRVFGLMRLTGMSARGLRKVISLEALLPVAAVFVGSIGFGALTAWALVVGASEGRRAVGWPEPGYYLILGACAVLMGIAVLGTFRTAVRATSGDATRFE